LAFRQVFTDLLFIWQEGDTGAFYVQQIWLQRTRKRIAMSPFDRILPFKNPNLWKGVGLGVVACVLLLAIAIPNLFRAKMSVRSGPTASFAEVSSSSPGLMDAVEADGPKIVRKAEMDLLVGNCSDTQKKIEALAVAESGFVESSTLEENSAKIRLRVPSTHLDETRAKLRELAMRVRHDGIAATDVSKQYFDREARLRNLRAEEQQFLQVMKKAHTVADILEVTKSLSETRGEIEQAETELRHLKDDIEMSEVDVSLTSQTSSGVHWSPGTSLKSAFEDLLGSLAAFGDFLIWLVVNIPIIALWIVAIFLLIIASWYVLRNAARIIRAIFGRKGAATDNSGKP
jgi:hypothetical protein